MYCILINSVQPTVLCLLILKWSSVYPRANLPQILSHTDYVQNTLRLTTFCTKVHDVCLLLTQSAHIHLLRLSKTRHDSCLGGESPSIPNSPIIRRDAAHCDETVPVQSLDRFGRRGDMRDDSVEILFQSFLQEALLVMIFCPLLRSFLRLPDLLACRCQDCCCCLASILKQLRGEFVHSCRLSCVQTRHNLCNPLLQHRLAFSLLCGGLVTLEKASVLMEFVVV